MTSPQQVRVRTPERYQLDSSTDDFLSAHSNISSVSDVSSNWAGFSPGTRENPIPVENLENSDCASSINTSFDDDDEIPTPTMRNETGKQLSWDTLDLCFEALQLFAKEHGFAVKKSTLKKFRGMKDMQYINCCRGGQKNTTKVLTPERKRQSRSLIGDEPCPFRACIKRQRQTNRWILEIVKGCHNHVAADQATVYAVHRRNARRSDSRIVQQLNGDYEARILPKQSWHSIRRTHPDVGITLKDVQNERLKYATLLDGGLPAIQAMIRDMGDAYIHQEVVDEHGHLVHFLYCYSAALQLLRRYPYTIGIDCTYKTNRHGLYLCQIIGMTALNTSFVVGHAFLSAEDTEAFSIVLRWLRDIYVNIGINPPLCLSTDRAGGLLAALKTIWPNIPHVLCIWHINNDIESYCKTLFRNQWDNNPSETSNDERTAYVELTWKDLLADWRRVYQATSELEYNTEWTRLCDKWSINNQGVVDYLRKTWIIYKERFCQAWTSNILHFGNLTTSRTESMHRAVKHELPHRQGHLREAVRAFKAFIERSIEDIEYKLGVERIRIDMKLRYNPVFRGLHDRISSFAIRKVLEHVESFKNQSLTSASCCTNTFSRQWGLPCAHIYREKQALKGSLRLTDFHPQWHLDPVGNLPPIDPLYLMKDPIKVRSRLAQNQDSNRRELSRVEHVRVEGASKQKQPQNTNGRINTAKTTTKRSKNISQSIQNASPKLQPEERRKTHVPASMSSLEYDIMSNDPPPLYLCDLGGNIKDGGFKLASEFVDWDTYNADPKFFYKHTEYYAVSRYALSNPIAEDHTWTENEAKWWNDDFWGDTLTPDAVETLADIEDWVQFERVFLQAKRQYWWKELARLQRQGEVLRQEGSKTLQQGLRNSSRRRRHKRHYTHNLLRPAAKPKGQLMLVY